MKPFADHLFSFYSRFALIVCLLSYFSIYQAQGLKSDWAFSIQTTFSNSHFQMTASEQYVYTSGSFQNSIDCDPDTSTLIFTSQGTYDVFIQKLDTLGNLVWAKQIMSSTGVFVEDIKTDVNENVYLTGSFHSTTDFDPGSGVFSLSPGLASSAAFVLKLDAQGNFIWAKSFAGSGGAVGRLLSIDSTSNVFISGRFDEDIDLDPGIGVNLKNSASDDFDDLFIVKLDSSGVLDWAHQIGGKLQDQLGDMVLDNQGDLYITGTTPGYIDLDPGPNLAEFSGNGAFLLKLSNEGLYEWGFSLEGNGGSEGYSIGIDLANNVYWVGKFSSTVDFMPGNQTHYLASDQNQVPQMFFAKYSIEGEFKFANKVSTGNQLDLVAIDISSVGEITLSGRFNGTINIDQLNQDQVISPKGGWDMLIYTTDTSGMFLAAKTLGNIGCSFYLAEHDVSITESGIIYISGIFFDSVDFDFGIDTNLLLTNGSYDPFVMKLIPCQSTIDTLSVTACNQYTWENGITYFEDNTNSVINYNSLSGCDSLVVLDLTILDISYSVDSIVSCDSLTWINGVTYTSSVSGVFDTLVNSVGCDSIVSLYFEIRNDSIVDSLVACDSLTWIDGNTYSNSISGPSELFTNAFGCDSIMELNLEIKESSSYIDSIFSCGSYTWIDGNTYDTTNNSALFITTNQDGCDSIIHLNLVLGDTSSSSQQVVACDDYTWIDGVTYTESQDSIKTKLINSFGCDSLVELSLIINESDSIVQEIYSCTSYTWIDGVTYHQDNSEAIFTTTNAAGCDSSIYLQLTIDTVKKDQDVQFTCDSLIWINGITYYQSTDTPSVIYTNSAGCDSIISLKLTVNSINSNVITFGNSLFCSESEASYQWLICDSAGNSILPFDTNQMLIPLNSGSYSVAIEKNGCVDTTDCVSFTSLSIEENRALEKIEIYPNPTIGEVNFLFSGLGLIDFIVFDSKGKIIHSEKDVNQQIHTIQIDADPGVYFVEFQYKGTKLLKKLVLF